MLRKIFIFLLSFMLILLCGCSKESKFGVEQFVSRMNNQFDYSLNTTDFILAIDEKGENNLFLEREDSLVALSLDTDNNIKGVSLLFTEEEKLSDYLSFFCHICSVFTGNDYNEQKAQFESCRITENEIKFADSSMVTTVGKYKCTIVCNEFSVTLFCDRV